MALTPGTRLGPYEVTAQIGVGGMGEVYRATDINLKRAVAIKVLPEAVAADAERLARFQREAQVLAALNHPNIAAIYGLERSGGITALVMELVEGPTLADRIAHGPIPLDEALPIATQIAEALEAAHEQGIIHRDLKPANIKVRPDGTVKVLDFGLAKAMEPAGAISPNASMSPTITSPAHLRQGYGGQAMTGVGMILGTAAYMSPEQARGKAVDKRADIWAFGCVVFEMLTGIRAFMGEEITDILAAIVRDEPDFAKLPAGTPTSIRRLLKRCLEKDRRERLPEIGTARLDIRDAVPGPNNGGVETSSAPAQKRRAGVLRAGIAVGAAVVAAATVSGVAAWFATRAITPVSPRVSRLALVDAVGQSTAGTDLTLDYNDHALAITPDGSLAVYVGNKRTQIFVRALTGLQSVPVFTGSQSEYPTGLFVSPDGQWIGFRQGNTTLKRVAVTGGPAITISTLDGASRGGTWGPDDAIIVATNNPATGLQRVSAAGGSMTVLTRPDQANGEADHLWPEFLPNGNAVLFTITALTGTRNDAVSQIAALDLRSGTRKILLRGGSHARYVASGHLVYMAGDALRAVPFDVTSLEIRGNSVAVIPVVQPLNFGGAQAVVATDGTLIYVSGRPNDERSTLVWVDRQGRETPIAAPVRDYRYPRISPDGKRIALFANDQGADLWIWDMDQSTLTRVTSDAGIDNDPAWTPDGRRLIFKSQRAGANSLFVQLADGNAAPELLAQGSAPSVSPDGRIVFTAGGDLMSATFADIHNIKPLVQSGFAEDNGVVSPDGRWLAYQADDSGRNEIYVRSLSDVRGARWQVSSGGGEQPLWSPHAKDLFYISPAGALMGTAVLNGALWRAAPPEIVVREGSGYYLTGQAYPGRKYDLTADGQRFLMIKRIAPASDIDPARVIVVQNWGEELKRLVPRN